MAFEVHTAEDYGKYTIDELKQKRFLANLAIKTARGELGKDDRAQAALEHYRSERRSINQALHDKMYANGPLPQFVGLKTISAGSRAPSGNRVRGVANLEDFLKIFQKEFVDG